MPLPFLMCPLLFFFWKQLFFGVWTSLENFAPRAKNCCLLFVVVLVFLFVVGWVGVVMISGSVTGSEDEVDLYPVEGGQIEVTIYGDEWNDSYQRLRDDPPTNTIKEKMGLSFRNVGYSVPSPSTSTSSSSSCLPSCCGGSGGEKKGILFGVGGVVPPGSFLAILGPSGAGKTSLLNILAQRKQTGVTGNIEYGGRHYNPGMKESIAYCVQDDILIPCLTVRETLMFSLNFRLNQTGIKWTKEQKQERVNTLLKDLLLQKVADSTVGSPEIKGISGGEKRRLSIGCELVLLPSLLFLDEPTTGLDSYSALKVMEMIKGLCQKGVSVVSTLHQPRSNIFNMFDLLLLLADGRVVYFGLAQEMVPYFANLGFPCPLYVNPADFIFDTLHHEGESEDFPQEKWDIEEEREEEEEERVSEEVAKKFTKLFQKSKQNELLQKSFLSNDSASCSSSVFSIQTLSCSSPSSPSSSSFDPSLPPSPLLSSSSASLSLSDFPEVLHEEDFPPISTLCSSFAVAQFYLLHRSWLSYSRNRSVVFSRGMAAFFAGVLIGLIFFDQGDDVANLVSASCFLICAFGLFCLSTISVYIENQLIFQRDYQRGYYSAFSFGFSNQIVEFPILIAQVLIYAMVSYWMVGFSHSAVKFFVFILIVFLQTEIFFGVCQIFSLLCNTTNSAIAGYISFYLFCLALGGFLIPPSSMPGFIHKLMYTTPFWYGYSAVLVNQFEDYSNGQDILTRRYPVADQDLWLLIGILAQYYIVIQLFQAFLLEYFTKKSQ